MDLILASGSAYRRELLERLQLTFRCLSPDIDESPLEGEHAAALSQRLAQSKATVISKHWPDAWVIGSDQVAALGDQALGKPGTTERAREQLRACSGHSVIFHTAVHLCRQTDGFQTQHLEQVEVRFRTLSDAEIDHYLEHEFALDCAGSFRCEGLGISLFESIDNHDPSALIGLPLIALCRMLRSAGINPLQRR